MAKEITKVHGHVEYKSTGGPRPHNTYRGSRTGGTDPVVQPVGHLHRRPSSKFMPRVDVPKAQRKQVYGEKYSDYR